jgi:thioredoxin-related protein
MLRNFIIIGAILLGFTAKAQEVKWYSIEEAIKLNKKEPRKLVIDVYTTWCGWCKVMEKNTFSNAIIANYLNTKFYPVRFNAEQTEPVIFNSDTFRYVSNGSKGYNQFAAALMNNQLSFPTIVFMDEQLRLIYADPGYKDAKAFDERIKYFGNDAFKTQNFDTWLSTYKSPFLTQ